VGETAADRLSKGTKCDFLQNGALPSGSVMMDDAKVSSKNIVEISIVAFPTVCELCTIVGL